MTRSTFAALVALMACFAPVSADAQTTRPGRPYRGLFGGGVGDVEQLLEATASASGVWVDNLVADARGRRTLRPSDLTRQFRGGLGTMTGALSYSLNRERFAVSASGVTVGSYYPALGRFIWRDYANVGASAPLVAGLSVDGGASYQPYNLNSLFPLVSERRIGEVDATDYDVPASIVHYFSYYGGAAFTRRLTRRGTFSATYDYRARTQSSRAGRFESHSAGASYTQVVGKGLGLRAGYRYFEGRNRTQGRRLGNHVIDAGATYSRSLSLSRSTSLSFGSGTSAITYPQRSRSTRYRATGDVRLNHEIGRTWSAGLAYIRGLLFAETWPEPLYSDSATASFGGLINRRLSFQSTARAMSGSTVSADRRRFKTYRASAGIAVGLTRNLNAALTYSYSRYQFDDGILLAPGFARDLDRQSIRASLNFWAPLFQRTRRP